MAEMKMATPNAGVDVGKLSHSYRAGENEKRCSLSGKRCDSSLKTKHTTTTPRGTTILGLWPRETKTYIDTQPVKDVGSSFIPNSPKLETTRSLSTVEWLHRLWHLHTVDPDKRLKVLTSPWQQQCS